MSNTHDQSTRISFDEEEAKIIRYLEDFVAGGGQFIKAKHIAYDLGLNPRIVGAHLALLAEISDNFTITRWNNAACITWSITRKS